MKAPDHPNRQPALLIGVNKGVCKCYVDDAFCLSRLTMINNQTERTLLTVRQFREKHPAFTEGGLRHLIFYADKNGFLTCIRRIGRKVLLDEHAVFTWVDEQNQPASNQRV